MTGTMSMKRAATLSVLFLAGRAQAQSDPNVDQFNYRQNEFSVTKDYGPEDWDNVRCTDFDICLGWPEGWETGIEWELETNSCRWCPDGGAEICGTHHQSPINLERNKAILGDPGYNECFDKHWMAYHDSSCSFEDLVDKNAFSIERYALKINQPLTALGNDNYKVDCNGNGEPRFGRIDFSKGFSDWWHLSHMDFNVPSEHTQEGKRYSGELQMYHFYSVSGRDAGVDNQMAAISVFLEAYDDSADWDVLNRVICQWRAAEERTRAECDLPSIYDEYPGCFYYRRDHVNITDSVTEQLRAAQPLGGQRALQESGGKRSPSMSAYDVIMHNHQHGGANNATHKPRTIQMSDADHEPEEPDFDWDAFIKEQYKKETETEHVRKGNRELLNYDHVGPWHNYFPMLDVRTEYYYRYEGTQTVPPCHGRFTLNSNRGSTNHWRVMKDPMRVSQRQIDEMHRLLIQRIAPLDDPLRSCQSDTAGKVDTVDPTKISVARPLQYFSRAHREVFCECTDWTSKWVEDQAWCTRRQTQRYYDYPYNFATDGF